MSTQTYERDPRVSGGRIAKRAAQDQDASVVRQPAATGPRIGGRIRVDLRRLAEESLVGQAAGRIVWCAISDAPAGAELVLVVACRQMVDDEATGTVRCYGRHLSSVTVECDDASTIAQWCRALRGEDVWGVLG